MDLVQRECKRCGWTWIPRILQSARCPKCKSYNWDRDFSNVCYACNRHFAQLCVHHIDGDRHNNKQENKLFLCSNCHSIVHNGNSRIRRTRSYVYEGEETLNKLKELRNKWLDSKKLNASVKLVEAAE